jgi:hypothetical protein
MFKTILKTYPKVYRVIVSFYIGVYTHKRLGYLPIKDCIGQDGS